MLQIYKQNIRKTTAKFPNTRIVVELIPFKRNFVLTSRAVSGCFKITLVSFHYNLRKPFQLHLPSGRKHMPNCSFVFLRPPFLAEFQLKQRLIVRVNAE